MAFNALVDGWVTAPDPGAPPVDSNAGATMGAGMGPAPIMGGPAGPTHPNVHQLQGIPPLTGMHNTPLQVGFLGILALGIVILLRWAGFRFSFAGNVAGGR